MANQIALNLAISGEEAATLATADHIASFWDARMKERLFVCADRPQNGLSPIAARAVWQLRTRGAPPAQSAATVFRGADPVDHSDAGSKKIPTMCWSLADATVSLKELRAAA